MSDDRIEVTWEDPPEHAIGLRKKTPYTEFAKALRENPGRWAIAPGARKTPDSARNTAQNLTRGTMKDFKKGQYETALDGTKLYVRYVGDKTQEQTQPAENGSPADEVTVGGSRYKAPDVRAWARANGFEIGDRGVLPHHVIAAFEEAHEDRDGDDDAESEGS